MELYQKIKIDILEGILETVNDNYECDFKICKAENEISLWNIKFEKLKEYYKELGKMIKEIEEIKVRDNI